jgi:hypothetical protein
MTSGETWRRPLASQPHQPLIDKQTEISPQSASRRDGAKLEKGIHGKKAKKEEFSRFYLASANI